MRPFREGAIKALGRPEQREALERALELSLKRRASAISEVPNWEALRDRARAIKEKALAGLDGYLETIREKVEARGGTVHFASDAEEARKTIGEIAGASGLVIKGKSMVAEEMISLRRFSFM